MVTRRDVLKGLAALYGVAASGKISASENYHEARYWHVNSDIIICELCPVGCNLAPGKTGRCRNRKNLNGKLVSLGYAMPCAVHVDPIEKKPLYHILPGARTFSVAIAGCNLRCKNCQNHTISQASPLQTDNTYLPPEKVIEEARRTNCSVVAYTYTEPTVWIEYMLDVAYLAHKNGLKNVLITCGYINLEPFEDLAKLLDAANIDLKSFDDSVYSDLNAGKLEPVLSTIKMAVKNGIWLEITNLIIPQWNDKPDMIMNMCRWINRNLGTDIPLHFSRFYPMHKLAHLYPTPHQTLKQAREIALKEKLRYVYIGNVPGEDNSTYCPECKKLLIDRNGYIIKQNLIKGGKCTGCGFSIAGVWDV